MLFVGSGDRLADPQVGLGRTVAYALLLICFIPDLQRYSVPLFLKRLCDRTLLQDAAATLRLLQPGRRLLGNITVGGEWGHGDFLWSVHAARLALDVKVILTPPCIFH